MEYKFILISNLAQQESDFIEQFKFDKMINKKIKSMCYGENHINIELLQEYIDENFMCLTRAGKFIYIQRNNK